MLRLLDLFSGIGGFSYAAERLLGGFETVQFVEREPFCQRVLRKHWPDVPIHADIRTFRPAPGSADVICGGFPCQDISVAGKGAGIKEGTRSGLFFELMRVVREVRPRFVVLENVSAITHNGLGVVLGQLWEAGFDAEWATIRASDVGACHQRDRWWCVAYQPRWEDVSPHPLGLCGERWRTSEHLVGEAGTGQTDRQQQQRDGNAADDCGATTAYSQSGGWGERARSGESEAGHQGAGIDDGGERHVVYADDKGPQGRQPALLRQHAAEWTAWSGGTPGGRLNPDWRGYVSEPVLRRGDDGLSGRVDRLKALGNAVVPQVAAIPLARVLELAYGEATAHHP